MSSDERNKCPTCGQGWRDAALRERHRLWGVNVPAADIDLFIEYDKAYPRACIEYKREEAGVQHSTMPNNLALIRLCKPAEVPVIAVRYAADFSGFTATPLNDFAKAHVPECITLSEEEYVKVLYTLRDREMSIWEYNRFLEKTRKEEAS